MAIVKTLVYRGVFQSLVQEDPAPDYDDYGDVLSYDDEDGGGDDDKDDEGHQTYYGRTWDLLASWYRLHSIPLCRGSSSSSP